MSKPDDLGDGLAIRGMSFSPWKQSLLGEFFCVHEL